MCSHSLRCASRFILRRGGQLGLFGHRTGRYSQLLSWSLGAGDRGSVPSCTVSRWGPGDHLLPRTELDGEGAPSWVHLKDGGLPAPGHPTAVPAVDEELPDLLSYRDVVHHHCQLGIVHRTLLWGEGMLTPQPSPQPHKENSSLVRSWSGTASAAPRLGG